MFSSNIEHILPPPVLEKQQLSGRILCSIDPNISSCCCTDYGPAALDCYSEREFYAPGEAMNIFCSINPAMNIYIPAVRTFSDSKSS